MNIPACVRVTKDELDLLKYKDKIEICCPTCSLVFTRTKFRILESLRQGQRGFYCTSACRYKAVTDKQVIKKCKECSSTFTTTLVRNAQFCTQSCAATYNNTHKKHGTRRSKLECWLENELRKKYNIEIQFNQKTVINSELDVFIPSLKLAFEINGVFHYKPIYGNELLENITNNDALKSKKCLEQNIELHCINTCDQKRFTVKGSEVYFNTICQVIDNKMASARGIEPLT